MLVPEEIAAVAAKVRTAQIIILALIAGPMSFLIFVLTQPGPAAPQGNISPIAAGFGALQMVLSIVLPQVLAVVHRKAIAERRPIAVNQETMSLTPAANDAEGLMTGWLTRRIIAGALLEGGAFFNIVAYQLERQTYNLAIAAALLVAVATLIPLRTNVESWLDGELRTVRDMRELAR